MVSDTPFPEDPLCHFYRPLLEKAQLLLEQGFSEAAIVTAQSACELCAEQVFTEWLERRGVTYLEDSFHQLLPNYNVANPRVQQLYQALTGDAIQSTAFWQAYKELTKQRNLIVDKGVSANPAEAARHLQAASDITKHMLDFLSSSLSNKA